MGFAEVAAPLRPEILAHCYRMLGSAADAEDAVQDAYLRAWRGFDRFEGRSSLRTWLYQIATNVCLRLADQRGRRALPAGLGAAEADWQARARPAPAETRWLSPLPVDPADEAGARQQIRLAFVAALQHLPAKQRAVLILRDVADLPADEVAATLGTTTIAVNSALLRARDRLRRLAPDPDGMTEPDHPHLQKQLLRYVDAFERADVEALAAVLREDVTLEMPPHATWFTGRRHVLGFLATHVLRRPGQFTMLPVTPTANGQPTFAMYADREAHALHVLEIDPGGIRSIHIFLNAELFPMFGQPVTLAPPRDLLGYDSDDR
ncbi:RNA polymerase sigma factor [Actinoplanes ianthinogenes]|uniref:RNA polymerase sigma factor n=1 Tax=Actinoplanes ianthinogenes TaxID=122358 RepID=A0ABM7LKP4_9ACTN|nr:RNA polymerase subunit sigma-70 [Actinoplanes ianthinogenes]BCJ39743.1 RNA polymerase sigma factor [Actinoplanes ianthinogenes]GGR47694.1 RNA polymerase sigma factor [Actinoplanes ianthinogenes]